MSIYSVDIVIKTKLSTLNFTLEKTKTFSFENAVDRDNFSDLCKMLIVTDGVEQKVELVKYHNTDAYVSVRAAMDSLDLAMKLERTI